MISIRRGVSAATIVALAAIAASCGGGSESSGTDADTVPAAEATVANEAPVAGTESDVSADAPELLQFTSPLVGGGELDAATLATKPTAFWFWSPT